MPQSISTRKRSKMATVDDTSNASGRQWNYHQFERQSPALQALHNGKFSIIANFKFTLDYLSLFYLTVWEKGTENNLLNFENEAPSINRDLDQLLLMSNVCSTAHRYEYIAFIQTGICHNLVTIFIYK
jgi:hypothetical protein